MAPLFAVKERPSVDGSFETVYRRHVRDVYGFALGLLGNASDAEDVAQTTFLNAYRARERGEDVENMRAWLLTIAHNVCRQRFRTAARRPREVELDPEAAEAFTDDDAPKAHEIREALDQLSFNQRTILVLREIEGLSYEEIAQAMDLSLSAVETLLFRARQALREQLEAAEHGLGCDAVQRLISLQLDGKLSRQDRGLLRAHLRTCGECAHFARSQRARKRAMPGLVAVPLPASLAGAFEGGAGFFASKAAVVAVAAALLGTGALVETGVLPVPGKNGEPAQAAAAASERAPAASFSPSMGIELVAAKQAERAKEQAASAATAAAAGKANRAAEKKAAAKAGAKAGGGTKAGTSGQGSNGGASGGSSPSGSSGGSGSIVPPPPPAVTTAVDSATGTVGGAVNGATGTVGGAVDSAVGTVGGAVEGAKDKVPPLPVSPPVEAPSLPPVSLPATGTLP